MSDTAWLDWDGRASDGLELIAYMLHLASYVCAKISILIVLIIPDWIHSFALIKNELKTDFKKFKIIGALFE